ncbi:urease subunit beta [Dyadobacter sp. CY312]|nr:urease subunit beta [Dyadobacter sp. CY312]MCE7042665.1 urease subunit beta [Dyadobacter sp. CY312]
MVPGEYILAKDDIVANVGKRTDYITVVNTGDRPVQVGSHFHFFETNKQLAFNRGKAYGMRLNIASGTAVRFEPGEEKDVMLVEISGGGKIFGFNNLIDGELSGGKEAALEKASAQSFKNIKQ